MSLSENLRLRRAELIGENKGILFAAEAAGGVLSDAQARRDDEISKEVAEIDAELDRLKRRVANDNGAGARFSSLGEQAIAIARSEVNHRKTDLRLLHAGPMGMSEGFGGDGGFLVQDDFAADLLAQAYAAGEISSRLTRLPVSNPSSKLVAPFNDETSRATGSRWGGVKVYFADEAETVTGTRMAFGQVGAELHKLLGLCHVTDELLQDAPMLGETLTRGFTSEFTWLIEDMAMNGPGGARPIGWLRSNALITVAAEGGQAAGTILPENVAKMWARLPLESRKTAAWIVSKDSEKQLGLMAVKVKNVAGTENVGGLPLPTYLPAGSVPGSMYAYLNGAPVLVVEYAEQAGVLGDLQLVDLSQYLVIEKSLQQNVSMHLRFIYHESAFRFSYRFNGQPIWSKPRSPYRGSDTESPFIVLAAR